MKLKKNKILTPQEALTQCASFCAYQERCQQEVYEKLQTWGITGKDSDTLVDYLIAENYLNEERFAEQFVSGKFRVNQWGKIKIRYMLKQKQIPHTFIEKALNQISTEEYIETLVRLIHAKSRSLPENLNKTERYGKIFRFMSSKGFEPVLVTQYIDQSSNSDEP